MQHHLVLRCLVLSLYFGTDLRSEKINYSREFKAYLVYICVYRADTSWKTALVSFQERSRVFKQSGDGGENNRRRNILQRCRLITGNRYKASPEIASCIDPSQLNCFQAVLLRNTLVI